MAFQPHPNLLSTTVVTPPSPVASGTSMTVSTAWATKVAALSLPVMATVSPDFTEPDDSNSEIVQITAANGGTGLLTIVRARESTSARNIAAGDRVRIGLTAKSLTDIEGVLAWTNERLAKTADYTIANADRGKTLALGGAAYFTLTLNAASGYDANFAIRVVNEDTGRAKRISPNGLTSFLLYPGQDCMVFAQNNAWKATNPGRWRLTGSVTVYVDGTNGNANNDGLASGSGNALATLQQAANMVRDSVDLNGQAVTISVADGTYTAGVSMTSGWTGAGTVTFTGNTGTPSNCVISVTSGNCFQFTNNVLATIGGGFKLQTTTSGSAVRSETGAVVTISGAMEYGACATNQLHSINGGRIIVAANYTISGGCSVHAAGAGPASLVNIAGLTITLTGTPAWGVAFAQGFNLGNVIASSTCTFSGSATGARYTATLNGVVRVDGAASTYFPGNSAGSTASGGQYA